ASASAPRSPRCRATRPRAPAPSSPRSPRPRQPSSRNRLPSREISAPAAARRGKTAPMGAANGKANGKFARCGEIGLAPGEFATLWRLDTPQKIQGWLNATPINHELDGETVLSVREVIRQRRAHCIEGAMFAACALWVHGDPPLVMHLDCHESDYPHVIALFRRSGAWGAISKTNGAPLRYRDPVYRTLRELAM